MCDGQARIFAWNLDLAAEMIRISPLARNGLPHHLGLDDFRVFQDVIPFEVIPGTIEVVAIPLQHLDRLGLAQTFDLTMPENLLGNRHVLTGVLLALDICGTVHLIPDSDSMFGANLVRFARVTGPLGVNSTHIWQKEVTNLYPGPASQSDRFLGRFCGS